MIKVDVATPKLSIGESRGFSFGIKAAELDLGDIADSFNHDIFLSGEVVNTGRLYRVTGKLKTRKSFTCDRCLTDGEREVELELAEEYAAESGAPEVINFDGTSIPLDELVRDTLLIAEPLSEVCQSECRGLCPICGKNLNDGDCGCDTFVSDPRLAKLKDLMNKEN